MTPEETDQSGFDHGHYVICEQGSRPLAWFALKCDAVAFVENVAKDFLVVPAYKTPT
jgi:hypothetical protein